MALLLHVFTLSSRYYCALIIVIICYYCNNGLGPLLCIITVILPGCHDSNNGPYCTAGRKTGSRGLDLRLGYIGIAYLTGVILQCGQPLHCWSDTLKSAFAHSRKIAILKIWSQLLLFVQSYFEKFLCHQAAAVPVLPTNNISLVCRYITEIWPVSMACTWKICVLLAEFWGKIMPKYRYFIWAKRSTALCTVMIHSACSIVLLLASFDVLLPSESKKQSWIDNRDFPLKLLIFALLIPRHHVAFSSEPSCNLLGATILDIISTCCAHVLSLLRARSPPPHAARDSARAAAGPSTFWLSTSQWVPFRSAGWSY